MNFTPAKRKPWAKPLASLVEPCLKEIWRKKGFASSALLLQWREIAGENLGSRSEPVELKWPPRAEKADPASLPPATLHVRVESAFALEFQYAQPQLILRINAHFGWRAVGKIVIKQGPVAKRGESRRKTAELTPEAQAKLDRLAPESGEPLEQALRRLGQGVLSRKQ